MASRMRGMLETSPLFSSRRFRDDDPGSRAPFDRQCQEHEDSIGMIRHAEPLLHGRESFRIIGCFSGDPCSQRGHHG